MELTPGYKRTEVGVVPEEWEVAVLGNKTDKVGSGITPTGGRRVYHEDGRPFIRSQNVGWGSLLLNDIVFIDDRTHSTFPDTEIKIDDVFLNITGASIGRSAVADSRVQGGNVNQHVCIIRAKQSQLVPSYLNFFLLSAAGQRQIDSFQAGGNRQGLNFAQVRSIRIPLPRLPDQLAIAKALRDVDALLDGLDRLIAKKSDLKQATMQQLLTGHTRLPGFDGEWEVKPLEHAGRCLRGVTYQGDVDLSSRDTAHTKRLLRANNVQNATVVADEVQYVNAGRVAPHQVLKKDDILICMANGSKPLVGKAGLFAVEDGYEYTFGAFMGSFRTDSKLANPVFVFYLFQTGRYRNYINNLLAGSSINNLRPSSIESLEFRFPLLPEQTAIADALTDMDAELTALEERREKTGAVKQAMMQELLTGKTRLV